MRTVLKNILYIFRILLLTILVLVFLYMISAFLLSLLPTHPPEYSCHPRKKIYISSNGIHLDIIIPSSDIREQFLENLYILPGTKFVSFGWGDKEFYINTPEWSDLTLPVAFQAVFLKSESAMHVTCHRYDSESWKAISICKWQLDTLNAYIEKSFQKMENGRLKKLSFPGYNEFDAFYYANGSFSLFMTCNVWTNNALKKTGIRTSVWSPFTFGVLFHL